MAVNDQDLQTLNIAFNADFQVGLTNGVRTMWDAVATRLSSSTRQNEYSWVDELDALTFEAGKSQTFQKEVLRRYALMNYAVSDGIEVGVDDFNDDNLGAYNGRAERLGRRFANHPGVMTHRMLPWGTQPAGPASSLAWDGQPFFGTHQVEDGGSFVNIDSGGAGDWWFLLDTSQGLMPVIYQEREPATMTSRVSQSDGNVFRDNKFRWKARYRAGYGYSFPQFAYASNQDMTETNLEAAITAMQDGAVDQKGQPLAVEATRLVVSPSNKLKAQKLINRTLATVGDSNLPIDYGLELVVSRFVGTVPDAKYMMPGTMIQ